MPDSKSSGRVFFRLQNELLEALDELLPELKVETLGEVSDRSKAARHLLIEALEGRMRQRQRSRLVDEALEALGAKHTAKAPRQRGSRSKQGRAVG